MLLLVLAQMEGTARHLDPDYNLAEALQGYKGDIVRRRFSPERLQRGIMRSTHDWERLIKILPRESANLLERAQRGDLQLHVRQHGIEGPVNRLVYALLTAALLLGSSLLWAFAAPPTLFGISISARSAWRWRWAWGCTSFFSSGDRASSLSARQGRSNADCSGLTGNGLMFALESACISQIRRIRVRLTFSPTGC